jgi:hypothetical protein
VFLSLLHFSPHATCSPFILLFSAQPLRQRDKQRGCLRHRRDAQAKHNVGGAYVRSFPSFSSSCVVARDSFSQYLPSRTRVHSLKDNEIGAEGACAIAEALKSNATLIRLEWVPFQLPSFSLVVRVCTCSISLSLPLSLSLSFSSGHAHSLSYNDRECGLWRIDTLLATNMVINSSTCSCLGSSLKFSPNSCN